jgi:hypothetical protein
VTGRRWQVEAAEPWFRVRVGYLVRIVELSGRSVVVTTPYALLSSEAEWREYFADKPHVLIASDFNSLTDGFPCSE